MPYYKDPPIMLTPPPRTTKSEQFKSIEYVNMNQRLKVTLLAKLRSCQIGPLNF